MNYGSSVNMLAKEKLKNGYKNNSDNLISTGIGM